MTYAKTLLLDFLGLTLRNHLSGISFHGILALPFTLPSGAGEK